MAGIASENRCKYVRVRLLSAIHDYKHFRKLSPPRHSANFSRGFLLHPRIWVSDLP